MKENESSSWATPNTMDHLPPRSPEAVIKQQENHRKGRPRPSNLREQVDKNTVALYPAPRATEKYPTPAARDGNGTNDLEKTLTKLKNNERCHIDQLPNYIMVKEHYNAEKYPTPTVQDSDKATKKMRDNHQNNLTAVVFNPKLSNDTSIDLKDHLNPYWVDALMGLPQGWTALDGTETKMQGTWDNDSWEEGIPRVIKECPNRVDRIRLCGNGVVPQTACIAWRILNDIIK